MTTSAAAQPGAVYRLSVRELTIGEEEQTGKDDCPEIPASGV